MNEEQARVLSVTRTAETTVLALTMVRMKSWMESEEQLCGGLGGRHQPRLQPSVRFTDTKIDVSIHNLRGMLS